MSECSSTIRFNLYTGEFIEIPEDECPHCSGLGEIPTPSNMSVWTVPCIFCKGTGKRREVK
jgi:DnaJ-class molecular chaperone